MNKKNNQRRKNSKKSYKQKGNNFNTSSNSSKKRYRKGRRKHYSKKKSKTIDIATFINNAKREASENKEFAIKHTFADFGFDERIEKNLARMEFIVPTAIQDGSMTHIMAGEDLIGLANTGTGKTGAFLLPMINKVLKDKKQKVLIIAPTRELAIQIDDEFQKFTRGIPVRSATVIGGVSAGKQIHNLKRNPNFIIGTPGRLKDLFDRRVLRLQEINNIVLDEVDRMLDMGFLPTVRELLSKTQTNRQVLFFSATLPADIKKLAGEFLTNPEVIERQTGRTTSNVAQEVVTIFDPTAKFNTLQKILETSEAAKVLVFSETKRSVEKLTRKLIETGVKADSIHGDKSQYHRQRALGKFKDNKVSVMVATDVAARGLDIKGVTTVINYTVPQTYDDYVHRIGRTGRAEAKGRAITFISK